MVTMEHDHAVLHAGNFTQHLRDAATPPVQMGLWVAL